MTLLAVAAALGVCQPTPAADRALIMTIGQYPGGAALPGVDRDRDSALRLMDRLGFAPAAPVATPSNAALDLAGMRRSLDRLLAEVLPGDRVFVYYSGHGTSQAVPGGCQQGLLSFDGQVFTSGEMSRYLAGFSDKADQVVLVLDACFSGGVAGVGARRSITDPTSAWRPKYSKAASPAPGDDACARPSNFLVVAPPRRGAVNLERNFLYIAAAREDEVAFDHEERGGLATTSLLQCLDERAGRTRSVDIPAWRACAQAGVETALPADPRLRPQHLVWLGNEGLDLQAPAARPGDAVAPTTAETRLASVLAGRDPGWSVQLRAVPTTLKIKQDMLSLSVTSARDGHLSLFYLGSDGRELVRLYPSRDSEPSVVHAGVPFQVPRRWRSEGPSGVDRIVAVVSAQPPGAGPGAGAPPASPCMRNLAAASDCQVGPTGPGLPQPYGASEVRVTEVP